MQLFEDRRDIETIDKKRRSPGTVGMGKEMEELKAAWIGLQKFHSGVSG
jgi:hypothetical protein